MKRSQINQIMKDAVTFSQEMKFQLPPFAFFPAEKWAGIGREWQEVKDNMLGWDITDSAAVTSSTLACSCLPYETVIYMTKSM